MRQRWAAAVLALLIVPSLGPAAAAPVVCRSPDGTLTIELALRKGGTVDGVPHYRVCAGEAGLDNVAWYDGTIVPYQGADPTKALPDIDLPEVLRYARAKGVMIHLTPTPRYPCGSLLG
jgi:hypothetical protein